jgi:hypothetical protein
MTPAQPKTNRARSARSPLTRLTRLTRLVVALGVTTVIAACSHNKQPDDEISYRPDPIPVHVRNENYLDMNVAVIAGSATRRLGTVSGNSEADFKIDWSAAGNGQGVQLTATPIGGRGSTGTGLLNVAPGQIIEFRIGSVLRQSTVSVHDP